MVEPSMIKMQNVSFDFGHLLINDTSSYPNGNYGESVIVDKGKKNLVLFYENLFQMNRKQKGEEDKDIDYDREIDEITLPKPELTLPRAMPVPKEKSLSKWEKYRKEKGLLNKKRSRMVYSEEAKDWVPRWGKGSRKKIEKEINWAIEDDGTGINPFDKQSQQKQLKKAKQEKHELKNEINREKDMKKSNSGRIEKSQQLSKKKNRKEIKSKRELKKLDEDKKNLNKRLEQVQKSTASMGQFDKKLKNEKELNKIKKKKVSTEIVLNRKSEKSRDKMIMDSLLKQKH